MKSVKTHTKLPFGVTKDPGIVFHFHVSKMFKCWVNLGLTKLRFDQYSNEHKKFKKFKKRKTCAHSLLMSYANDSR
jgi:hypothetical protein